MIDKNVPFTKALQSYELTHWQNYKDAPEVRSQIVDQLFPLALTPTVVADVGCGPRCGVFQTRKFDTMYAVDPLWDQYNQSNLAQVPEGVQTLNSDAQSFTLPIAADLIYCINSIDHSGDLQLSLNNLFANLEPNGILCLHVHLRTPSQLNEGHRMSITEQDMDDLLSPWRVAVKQIYDKCPLDGKYRTYVAIVVNQQ